jgi:hypothetical protein
MLIGRTGPETWAGNVGDTFGERPDMCRYLSPSESGAGSGAATVKILKSGNPLKQWGRGYRDDVQLWESSKARLRAGKEW